MKRNSIKQYFGISLLLSLAIAVTIHFPVVLEYFFQDEGGRDRHRFLMSFTHLGGHLIITYIVALLDVYIEFLHSETCRNTGKA